MATLNNAATLTAAGTPTFYAYGSSSTAGEFTTFNNQAGASFNAPVPFTYLGYGTQYTMPDQFNNAGTLQISGGGTSTIGAASSSRRPAVLTTRLTSWRSSSSVSK